MGGAATQYAKSEAMERPPRVDTLTWLRGHDSDAINADPLRNSSEATTLWKTNTFQENGLANESLRRPTTLDTFQGSPSLSDHDRVSSPTSSSSKESQKSHKGFKNLFTLRKNPKPPKPSKPQPYLLDHSCFSADGNTLYLWKRRETSVALLPIFKPQDILRTDVRVRACGSAHYLAGGSSKYLVVTHEDLGKIEVYSNEDPSEVPPAHVSVRLTSKSAFAISRNDKFMAMSTKNRLTIWEIPPGSETSFKSREIPVPTPRPGNNAEVESQKTAFSADCEGIIVTTRYMDGFVSVRAWNVDGQSMQNVSMNTPSGRTHDYGLSSVFCDNSRRVAVVAVMASGVDRMLLSLDRTSDFIWPTAALQKRRFSYKITSAAQSPSGNGFVMATSDDRVFTFSLDRSSIEALEITGLCPGRSGCMDLGDGISLAFPDERTVYAFWFDERGVEMKFASITLEDRGRVVKSCYDIRSRFGYN